MKYEVIYNIYVALCIDYIPLFPLCTKKNYFSNRKQTCKFGSATNEKYSRKLKKILYTQIFSLLPPTKTLHSISQNG